MAEASWSDADLLVRAQGGDVQAFGQLVERHQDYVYNVIYHLLGSDQDAEDIAQEVFVRAYKNLKGFEGRARFTTWLYGIALNCVRSFWRRRRTRSVLSLNAYGDQEGGLNPRAEQDGPEEMTMRMEQVRAVRSAIAELEDELREIVVLRDMQGLSYEEIAQSIGIALGTVKSRLHRARQALKERLEPFFDRTG